VRKGAAAAAVAKVEPAWKTALVNVFDDHYHRYGALSKAELRELGHYAHGGASRTHGLRRHERKSLQSKEVEPRTTDLTHGKHCTPNLLLDQPCPTQANQVWRRPLRG
jgi:hypothetical protein